MYGITPAYAGKSGGEPTSCTVKWDHPRLCGEKALDRADDRKKFGSPPPMRGKENCELGKGMLRGITPAYAGKSTRCMFKVSWKRGSPPPMRGKVGHFGFLTDHKRITPAYAGKSPALRPEFATGQDHPRLCGEKGIFLRYYEFL